MNSINNDWQLQCIGISKRGAHILNTGEYSDCTFLVGNELDKKRISAHKIILAMSSPVFHAMFYGSIAESDVITIVDIEKNVFICLLTYIYTDIIDIDSVEKACELHYAAKKYMLPHLTDECVTYLSSKLCPENALKVFEFAKFNDNEDLMDKCVQVIQSCSQEVLNNTSFTEASLESVCMVFSMDPLNIDSELDLFAAAERYSKANKDCAVLPKNNELVTPDEQYVKENEKCNSLSEINKTATLTQLTEDKARPEATIRFTMKNFEDIEDRVCSMRHYIRNLPWQILVELNIDENDGTPKSLDVYLCCNEDSESKCWSCYATFEMGLVSHKLGTKLFNKKRITQLFHGNATHCGYPDFITWDDLFDPEKEYVKDDSITIEVHIAAEEPHGILGNSMKHTGCVGRKDKLTIRNAVRLIRFLTMTAEEFAKKAANSSLLDKSEENAIFMNLLAKSRGVPMPNGFCNNSTRRLKN